MAVKKTAEAAKEAVKTEAKAVKSGAEAVKNEVKAVEKKAAEKKAPAKRAASKASGKAAEKKETVYIQFAGKEIDMDSVVESAKADFRANNKGYVRKLEVYVKPEDSAAYYVVNGKISGKVDL
ncbi:DUF6465 family protein [Ruminococcus sp. Marseille-P6503]|uniref:DUF6465 family protein n=1 Tax=Ruminococcus sp. Marseille-P6503 TaxID=2364796 RepID=UPI000F54336E|nr:DUF6465 family protein [Ruminococcus sp. Marseille-P6503]